MYVYIQLIFYQTWSITKIFILANNNLIHKMGCYSSKIHSPNVLIKDTSELTISPGLFVRINPQKFDTLYNLGSMLNNTAQGKFRNCTHIASSVKRSVKILQGSDLDSDSKKHRFMQELEILKELDHPSIVRVIQSFIEPNIIYIVLQNCRGRSLFQEITSKSITSESDCAFIMKQIFSCLAYLHSKRIIHRNLKPEYIVFQERNECLNLKIIDFNSAIQTLQLVSGTVGSAYYVAPEVIDSNYGVQCDMWSAGVIMFMLICKRAPFDGQNDTEILSKIQAGEFKIDQSVSEEAKFLINNLLVPAKHRLTALEAIQDTWIVENTKSNIDHLIGKTLARLTSFRPETTLQNAIYTFISSQLVTANQTKEIRAVFSKLDENGDGKLSREELIKGYTKILGDKTEEYVDGIMAAVDVDHSGFIDYTEFLRVTVNRGKLLSDQNLKDAFGILDLDGSGKISAHELKTVLSGNTSSEDDIWHQLIKQFDLDNDGEIDIDEFKAAVFSHFW